MRKRKRKCGGCQYWIKINNNKYHSGLCVEKDTCPGSSHSACEFWKAIPYSRKKFTGVI